MVEDVRAEALALIAAGAETTCAAAHQRLDDWLAEPPLSEVDDPKKRILRLMGVA